MLYSVLCGHALLSEPAVADPRFIGPIDIHIVNNSHIFWEIFQKYL